MTLLKRLALATGRTHADTRTVAMSQDGRAMRLLYLMLLTSLLGLFLPAFVQQFAKWNNFKPDTLIDPASWRVLYKDTLKTCANDVTHDGSCPGSPANPSLWNSLYQQRDAKHKSRLVAMGPTGYWLGATIPVATLHDARIKRANQLLLGWVLSSYRIWIDGKLELGGTGTKDQHPIILPISPSRLAEARPLYVAIEIFHDSDFGMPDFLNALRGGEGFITPESASTFRDFVMFWETVRPFSLLVAYMVIGSLFFSFWLSRRTKTEYFYMALFALASAFYQARMTSIFSGAVSRSVTADLDVVLRFYIASFGLALGLAFARARLAYFRYGAPIALGLPILITLTLPNSHSKHLLTAFFQIWATPTFYILGGVVCIIQAWHLFAERKKGQPHPIRVRRLAMFATGFIALAVFYVLQFNGLIPGIMRVMWMGMGFDHFVSVIFFGTIMLAEYREQDSQPAALFKRGRPLLPEGLSGAVLAMRLTCPAALYPIFRSHFQTSVLKNNGAVVEREGELLAFFERDPGVDHDPAISALRAADELFCHSQLLSDVSGCELKFKGGLAQTSKRGGDGDETAAEAWRILENEGDGAGAAPRTGNDGCAVVLNDELARRLMRHARKFSVALHAARRGSQTRKIRIAA